MNPVAAFPIAFDEQFIEVLPTIIGHIKQDGSITDGLLYSRTSYIYGAARQVITRIHPAHTFVDYGRTIATRDDDRLLSICSPSAEDIPLIVSVSQLFQPWAKPFQILDNLVIRDIPVQTVHTRFAELSEREVRR